jgi:hypothetical protein
MRAPVRTPSFTIVRPDGTDLRSASLVAGYGER